MSKRNKHKKRTVGNMTLGTVQRKGFRFLEICYGAFLIIAAFVLSGDIETKFFPVVDNFSVTEAYIHDGSFILSGTLEEVRNCEYVSSSASVHIKDSNGNEYKRRVPLVLTEFYYGDSVGFTTSVPPDCDCFIDTEDFEPIRGIADVHFYHRCHGGRASVTIIEGVKF